LPIQVTVCVKRVPSTATRLRIAADRRSIDEAGVEFVLNPYDEFAVEEALRIAEKEGGEVTVVSFGADAATRELRNCLAMGAHKALHLLADAAFRDPLSTAKALAAAVRSAPADLLLFGRQAVDGDHAQVGLMVATLLGLPAVYAPGILRTRRSKSSSRSSSRSGVGARRSIPTSSRADIPVTPKSCAGCCRPSRHSSALPRRSPPAHPPANRPRAVPNSAPSS
jgi:hypothetical protein